MVSLVDEFHRRIGDDHGLSKWSTALGPIIVDGPLAPFADGLPRELAAQGYALDTIVDHVHLLADLSDWLSGRGLTGAGLTSEVAGEFLRDRRTRGLHIGVTVRAVMPIWGICANCGLLHHIRRLSRPLRRMFC